MNRGVREVEQESVEPLAVQEGARGLEGGVGVRRTHYYEARQVHAHGRGGGRIKGAGQVHVGGQPAAGLGGRDGAEGEGELAAGGSPCNLRDLAAGDAAEAGGGVELGQSGGKGDGRGVATGKQAAGGAQAPSALDLERRRAERGGTRTGPAARVRAPT